MLNSLGIKNLLSFGPEGVDVELRPLNVLIGPNGCGKSNFLTAIRILQYLPGNLQYIWNSANTAEDWFWGNTDSPISIELTSGTIAYKNSISREYNSIVFDMEEIRNSITGFTRSAEAVYGGGVDELRYINAPDKKKSIFAQKEPQGDELKGFYNNIRNMYIYVNKPGSGGDNVLKSPQSAEVDTVFLSEDFDNLAVLLHELNTMLSIEELLLEKFQKYYPRAERIYMGLPGGRPQVFIQEKVGNKRVNIPSSRLSDGTLYFLCLLTMLMHPSPPPLICIDEPEVGLHPDVLPLVAELLVEASKRTQIIITTHSDLLVSHIGKQDMEAILVCEHTPEKGTSMTRPDPKKLKKWLDESQESLGELWLRGAIGGTLY